LAEKRRYSAWITLVLIMGNVAVFFSTVDENLVIRSEVSHTRGFVPRAVFSGERVETLLTHMFLHADLLHLVSNMLALLFLGLALETRIGNLPFLGVYLFCGLIAALVFGLMDPASIVPSVGASAAIFGLMGTLALLYPTAFVFVFIIPVPVILVAIFYALTTISQLGDAGPVAHVAHLAGMVSGMFVAFLMRPEDAMKGLAIFSACFVAIVVMIQLI
jgi:membrane associated rhomboid family serine protease